MSTTIAKSRLSVVIRDGHAGAGKCASSKYYIHIAYMRHSFIIIREVLILTLSIFIAM